MSFKVPSWLRDVANFVSQAVDKVTPDQHAQLNEAANALQTAAQAIEGALPVLAKVAVDTALVAIGWGKYIPNADGIIDALISELQSRKTKAA